jgi:hypothetical protein
LSKPKSRCRGGQLLTHSGDRSHNKAYLASIHRPGFGWWLDGISGWLI